MKHAIKKDNFLYRGSPVCHDYGFKHFYYASCVMNCPFDCLYCFLKGKYKSDEIVVYDNLHDYFTATDNLLIQIPESDKLYLCVSFDSDLLALENKIHYVQRWAKFADSRNRLRCEVRTKAKVDDLAFWNRIVNKNMVFAFSLSPQQIIDEFEHGTASVSDRLAGINAALESGAVVRLCIDPIVYRHGWKQAYSDMIDALANNVDLSKIQDISIGTFRIPADYIKNMRSLYPENALAQFPYSLVNGFYQYPEWLRTEVEGYVRDKLLSHVVQDKIFEWK